MISEVIKKSIREALKELNYNKPEEVPINIDHPKDISHGDFSFTTMRIYLSRTGRVRRVRKVVKGIYPDKPEIKEGDVLDMPGKIAEGPVELAEKIAVIINKNKPIDIEKVEAKGGFVNFYLSAKYFSESLEEILEKDSNFGKGNKYDGKKVMVEYTDPNPFKVFHIGHLMSNSIGEAISRVADFSGAKIIRACWQGDVGLHVAKALWGMQRQVESGKLKVESLTTKEWGEAYVLGSEKYESDEAVKKEINELNKKIFDRSDEKVNELYDSGRKVSLEHFEEIYKKLGTHFDRYYFEGIEGRFGEKIVGDNLENGVFEKSEGAIVFKGEKYGLHTRVFINSQGLPTYEAKELGLNKTKFDENKDLAESIIVTGNEINDYFKVLMKVFELIFPEIAKRTVHLGHGMLQFSTGKMSSRKGNVITGETLIRQVEDLVGEKIAGRDFDKAEIEKVKTAVAVGAIKYSILKQSTGSNIIYDFEKSISFEGDSGPYIQYSYARAMSIIRKAGEQRIEIREPKTEEKPGELEKLLYRFPEIVARAANEYEPHYIVTYLTELAGVFNSYYANNPILEAGEATAYRLALTKAFTTIMRNGLNLLAIPVLEKM
ncbi:MAG TPA: arginine--tRNA ligase [Candidatus Paceibacterota bacterium]